jgi:hypothetical protein
MNRRDFLGMCVAAPVAAPGIAAHLSGAATNLTRVGVLGMTGAPVRMTGLLEASGHTLESLTLSHPAFNEFSAALDAPPQPNESLRRLMTSADLWTPHTPAAEPVPFVTDECRCPACVAPTLPPYAGAFTDGNGRRVKAGDRVEYRFGARRGMLVEALQDGDARVIFDDADIEHPETVKFCHLCKVSDNQIAMHPLQAITDAPPIVPADAPDQAMHRAAVEAGYAPLAEYVSERVFNGVRPLSSERAAALRKRHGRATHRRTVLAFTGLAGSGKSTAAAHLVNAHGFARVRFAGPLKDMMRALGLTEDEIEGHLKEQPCALLGGKTPRFAMQTIGTEWGRDTLGPDLWIRAWQAAVDKLPAGQSVVVDDCRFPNEAAAVRANGGALVRLDRRGAGTTSQHSSEGQDLGETIRLRNDGPLVALAMELDDLLLSQA